MFVTFNLMVSTDTIGTCLIKTNESLLSIFSLFLEACLFFLFINSEHRAGKFVAPSLIDTTILSTIIPLRYGEQYDALISKDFKWEEGFAFKDKSKGLMLHVD